MQRILIPTDFSPVADNALSHALEIAAQFGSELYLYHVFSLHKIDRHPDFSDEEQPLRKKLEKRMKLTRLKFADRIAELGLTLHTIVEQDSVLAVFDRTVTKHKIDLIVMGSKGASGFKKVIFGSMAATALQMAKVPVLVVPPEHSFSLAQIVLAIDPHGVSARTLTPLQKLAGKFGSKVTVLNVNTGSHAAATGQPQVALQEVETQHREVPMTKSVNESINDYIAGNQYGLLCMVRREKGFFESLFQKSFTQDQVYNSPIPLLVLPAA